ncbi:sugar transferase [Paenibacillus pinihumi]|uniref:sugar transferase n=1 Tax=Paenibacillus pinihumi TaxID=669462 RepID=UPI000418A1C4|nr:sugar transferase [Paenibacillus pinihumi]
MKLYPYVKRLIDIVFAVLLLVIASPIMLFAVFAIKMESRGPALFKQNRPGKNSRIFTVLKFRTMATEMEKDGRALSDMERMTRVGNVLRKTSIDELPQLINILRGEMSFIGPRPLLVKYLDYYTPEQSRRHEVMPGISGWAQVNGRNSISWKEKFKLDVWYVEHQSLSLDIKILLLTIYNVLKSKDINSSSDNTMQPFTGDVESGL